MHKKLAAVWLLLALIILGAVQLNYYRQTMQLLALSQLCVQTPTENQPVINLRSQIAGTHHSLIPLASGTIFSFALLLLLFSVLYRQIGAREQAGIALEQAHRALNTLTACNEAVIWAGTEPDLLGEICRILVETGGYCGAWIGHTGSRGDGQVCVLARHALAGGWTPADLTGVCAGPSLDLVGRALNTGRAAVGQSASAAGERRQPGACGAMAAFPLDVQSGVAGVLAIYARDPSAFVGQEKDYLQKLTRNLEYGLQTLRLRTLRERAEKALRDSEEQYRTLVESMNHGLAVVSRDGVITFVNPHFCHLLGYFRSEIIGRQVLDFFNPANREIARQEMARRRHGEQQPYEIEFTRKDGSQLYALVSPMPIVDQAGRFQGTLAVITDLSDRKRAEAQAQQSLHSLRLLINGVEKLAKIRDPETMVQEICQLVVEAFGIQLVWVAAAEPDGSVTPLNWAGAKGDYLQEIQLRWDDTPQGQGLTGRAIRTGAPAILNDLATLEYAPWRRAARRYGHRAAAAFPLIGAERTFAALNVYADYVGFFTPARVELLQAFAGIAAAALENARLSAKADRHLRQMQALRQIHLAISSSLDLNTTLNVLLDEILAQFKVDAASIYLLNPQNHMLEYAAGRGFTSHALVSSRIPLGMGCAGRVALEEKPVYIPDLSEVLRDCARKEMFITEKFVSYYAVPLVNKGQLKGVVEILHRSRLEIADDMLQFLEALAGQAAIAVDNASLFNEMQRSHLEMSHAYEATLEGWARALELRDIETQGHSRRVTELSVKLARALGVDDREIAAIYRGALLHDIGKIGVPDAILLKPGALTPEEWTVMREHPCYARELLSPISFLQSSLDIPYCHHEKWDGCGYPRGLKGEAIPLAARIFAVADVWDALSSQRPYRRAWPPEKIIRFIQEQAGTHFDPQVVQVFLEKVLPEMGLTQAQISPAAAAGQKVKYPDSLPIILTAAAPPPPEPGAAGKPRASEPALPATPPPRRHSARRPARK